MTLANRLRIFTAVEKSPHHSLFLRHGFSETGTGYEGNTTRHNYFAIPYTHDKRPLIERAIGLRRDLKKLGYTQYRNGDARKWTHPKGDSVHYYAGQVMHMVRNK
jgi:hypothetical protein